jgi:putative peptidoglycan lipid II flippase
LSVARSSILFASGTFLSRLTGLLRDRIVLSIFGSSVYHEAFIVAYRIPNLLRELLAEGALGTSFTKVFSSLAAEDSERAERLLVDAFYLMTLISVVVCAIGICVSPWLVDLMTMMTEPGPQKDILVQSATGLTKLLFPFLGTMTLGALAMGVLHQRGRFLLTSMSPIAFNVGNIIGAIWIANFLKMHGPDWLTDYFGDKAILGLAIGVLLGGLGQLIVQLLGLWRQLVTGTRKWDRRFPWSPDLKKILTLMTPMILASSAGQVNSVVNTMFATSVGEGAVVWLNSAFRLLHFPIGIFGVAIGAAVLPALARSITKAGGKMDRVSSVEAQNAIELVIWIMVPCFVIMNVNAVSIVSFLFQSGRFSPNDTTQTAAALSAYSFGLIAYGLIKVLTSFYYALDRTNYAMKVSLSGIGVNLASNYLLVDHFGHIALAYAYSATLSLSAFWLLLGLRDEKISWERRKLMLSFAYLLAASILAYGAQRLCQPLVAGLHWAANAPIWLRSGTVLVANGTLAVAIFAGVGLAQLRVSPASAVRRLLRRGR